MKKTRLINSRQAAIDVWNNRSYYRLENFLVSDLIKIYLELNPATLIKERMNHYKSFIACFKDMAIKDISVSNINHWFQLRKESIGLTNRTMNQIKCQFDPPYFSMQLLN